MTIFLDCVCKKVDPVTSILHTTTLSIPKNKTSVLIGPSGSGKSTLLRLIIGLHFPTSGTIFFDDKELNPGTIHEVRRNIGYVIQEGGLFPHLTGLENVMLISRFLKKGKDSSTKRLKELRDLVKLSEKSLSLYPFQLSGGERQRISLMRALFLDPDYLLLDEPLAALDPITRYELQRHLKELFSYLQKTVILVTHDMKEASYFGDDIILMSSGRVAQQGSFQELKRHPKDPFVTQFILSQEPPKEEALC